jgi:hypothetical protein
MDGDDDRSAQERSDLFSKQVLIWKVPGFMVGESARTRRWIGAIILLVVAIIVGIMFSGLFIDSSTPTTTFPPLTFEQNP